MMRLGLFGGTFDPVHWGHLLLAERCREACELDEVWLIPTGNPPHKSQTGISPAKARVEMLQMALAGLREYSVNQMEVKRQGTTYTYETLEQLTKDQPERELFFLIGADSLFDLPKWKKPERIAELATIVAVNRGGESEPDLSELPAEIAAKVKLVTMPDMAISSSEIRERVRNSESIRFMLPRAVETYIQHHQLYVAETDA